MKEKSDVAQSTLSEKGVKILNAVLGLHKSAAKLSLISAQQSTFRFSVLITEPKKTWYEVIK